MILTYDFEPRKTAQAVYLLLVDRGELSPGQVARAIYQTDRHLITSDGVPLSGDTFKVIPPFGAVAFTLYQALTQAVLVSPWSDYLTVANGILKARPWELVVDTLSRAERAALSVTWGAFFTMPDETDPIEILRTGGWSDDEIRELCGLVESDPCD